MKRTIQEFVWKYFSIFFARFTDAEITILCGCGWGHPRGNYEVSDGDRPVCPVCWYEFPMFWTDEYFLREEDGGGVDDWNGYWNFIVHADDREYTAWLTSCQW